MKASNILGTIGNTPHVRINNILGDRHEIYIKLERSNPGGSIKDRIALAMIEDAERRGILDPDSVIIEPTSGNTGVGLALVAAIKGYKLVLVMPKSMSVERRKLMAAYGARFVLTPKEKGTAGAVARARELAAVTPNAWIPQQFDNPVNPDIHRRTTAPEILQDFPDGLDYLVSGVGTGGHITAVAEVLKEHFPALKVYAVEPVLSPVLSGGNPGPHPLQGIGAGFVPSVLNKDILDGIIQVDKEDAFRYTQRLAREEGILAGISTGASLAAVAAQLPHIPEGAKVLTFNYDTGERYWSVPDLFDHEHAELVLSEEEAIAF